LWGQRLDMVYMLLPFFYLFWFMTPFAFRLPERVQRIITGVTIFLVVVYSLSSLAGGWLIVKSHLDYRGKAITDADVPLIQKMQAIDFIAQDWMSISTSKEIPVDYQLGGTLYKWVPEYGKQLLPWYPAPITWGRCFDYDLLRRYGLRNVQEGIQMRSFGTGRYLVTYAVEPEPDMPGVSMRHYLVGRLRVTIVDR
jgi:hypothetical protein